MNTSPKRQFISDLQPSAEEQAVNDRLVNIIKANAVRIESDTRLPRRNLFAQTYAIFSLVGLMVVAYVYSKFVDVEA